MTRLEVAVNPVPLGRARTVAPVPGRVISYLPEASRRFREEFQWALKALGVRKPFAGPLRVSGKLWRRCRRGQSNRGDLSNFIKAIEDAGEGLLWENDAQIVSYGGWDLVEWGPDVEGRILLEIVELKRVAS